MAMNLHEQRKFSKMMDKAGWSECCHYRHGYRVFRYENRETGDSIHQDELLKMSSHEFSAFIYRSRMEAEAREQQQEPEWMFTGGINNASAIGGIAPPESFRTMSNKYRQRNGYMDLEEDMPKPQPDKDMAYLRKKVDEWIRSD